MAEGFLGRWSQRKAQARYGEIAPEPPDQVQATPMPLALAPDKVPAALVASTRAGPLAEPVPHADAVQADAGLATPPPTLQEAQALGRDSDYRPFVARGVDPSVRNAAMKQLFADPHFNVMDRLDTYIDDYSQPDPLPMATLRKMASAQFLKLFDDEPTATPVADSPQPLSDHADPDLRLQQDHAPVAPIPGHGTQ
ncbi:MAG: DUF3306 domain-containing protein [Rhodoferax sp.]|nr:DUF3306 domain-containing protein [Rhodoferax sp.]